MTRPSSAAKPHVITGDRVQVCAALVRTQELGRLVSIGEAQLLPGDRVRVVADIRVTSFQSVEVDAGRSSSMPYHIHARFVDRICAMFLRASAPAPDRST